MLKGFKKRDGRELNEKFERWAGEGERYKLPDRRRTLRGEAKQRERQHRKLNPNRKQEIARPDLRVANRGSQDVQIGGAEQEVAPGLVKRRTEDRGDLKQELDEYEATPVETLTHKTSFQD